MPDAEFGIHPGDAKTNVTGLGDADGPISCRRWSPRWGAFNRHGTSTPHLVLRNTPTARDTYARWAPDEAIIHQGGCRQRVNVGGTRIAFSRWTETTPEVNRNRERAPVCRCRLSRSTADVSLCARSLDRDPERWRRSVV